MKKKVFVLVIAIVMIFAIGMAGCTSAPEPSTDTGSSSTTESSNSTEASAPATDNTGGGGKDLKFALVLHAMNSSFYAKIKEGAEKAGEDLGIQVDVMGPSKPSQLTEQVNMIESCITGGYDAIATVVWDPEGFNEVIKKAKDAGIPMVTCNNTVPDCGLAFVGQDLEQAGYLIGKYMFGDVMNGEGSYIMGTCAPAMQALIDRENGIKRANLEYPNIEYLRTIDIGTDLTGAVGVFENAYLANPELTAFIGVDVYSEAIGTFIDSQGLNGKLYGGGFDLVEGTLQHVKNNAMQVTVGQNPFLQGYYPMIELYLKVVYGYEPQDLDTGAFMVDKSNVDSVEPE